MRTVFLLPLTAVMAVVAACGSEGREEAAPSVVKRDLTLPARAPQVEIASAVELQQPPTHRTVGRSRIASRRAPARSRATVESRPVAVVVPAPALVLHAADTAARPVSTASEPVNDRELPPGKTVTVIPVSSGPSTTLQPTDEFPTIRSGSVGIRGGGRCPPRRPGIGIATRPRPVLY
jgi:hypothetical protein